jgi:hypothetical protein
MNVVAVLAVRNEERCVAACLENLIRQGVEVYVCDNESTDGTVERVEPYRGRGVIGLETIPFDGVYRWHRILRRKEELFRSLEADWLMHVDVLARPEELHAIQAAVLITLGFSSL